MQTIKTEIKRLPKKLLSVFLAVAMVFSFVGLVLPIKADAAAGDYTCRVEVVTTTYCSDSNDSYIDIQYRTNNGTGTQSTSQRINSGNGLLSSNGTAYSGEMTVSGFPNYIYVYNRIGGAFAGRKYNGTFNLQVRNASGWTTVASVPISNSSGWGSSTATGEASAAATVYPYVTTSSVTGADSVNSPTTSAYGISTTTDQYGVEWVNSPSWATSSSNTSIVANAKSSTVTFNNSSNSLDYTTNITATWATGNSSYASVARSKTVQVYVPHNITVNANGGSYSGTSPFTVYTGGTAALATPTRTGYAFTGWTASAGTVSGSTYTAINSNATLTANWSPIPYTMTLNPNGGSVSSSSVGYNITTTNMSLPTPTRTGYTFTGWTVSSPGGNWSTGETFSSPLASKYGNVTFTAQWSPNSYTINLDPNTGAVGQSSVGVTYDSAVGTLPTPTKNAYIFDGWYTAAEGGTLYTASTVYQVAGNTTLYAHWHPEDFTVTFDSNGGEAVPNLSYNIENGNLPDAQRDGYTHSKWEVVASTGNWGDAGTQYNPGDSTVGKYGPVSMKAIWTANPYTIIYNLNDANRRGEAQCAETEKGVVFDSAVGALAEPTLAAYEFVGWYTSPTGGTMYTEDTIYTVSQNVTLYAHWSPITYSATFDANGGSSVNSLYYTTETGFAFIPSLKTGYTLTGWQVDASSGSWVAGDIYAGYTGAPYIAYGDVAFTAVWDDNDYTLTFDLNDTTGIGSASCDTADKVVTYDSAVGELPTPTRTGYTFTGWYTQPEGGELYTADTVYVTDGDRTLYAHWELVEYTITFNTLGGPVIEAVTYNIETDLTLPDVDRIGYTFNAWINVSGNIGSWTLNQQINADALNVGTGNWGSVDLRGNFTIRYYDITWSINGVETTESLRFAAIPAHADPVIEDDCYDYTFLGWSPTIALVSENTTYTALFDKTPKVYTMTWVDDDGTILYNQDIPYGEAVPDMPLPERTGYTASWYAAPATMPAQNYTIEATYTINKYDISWVLPTGTVVESYEYGSVPSYTGETPTKASTVSTVYTFSGWDKDPVTVTDNATYTAQFAESVRSYTVTWDANGNISQEQYDYNTTPTYSGATPQKAMSATEVYTFAGWSTTENGEALATIPAVAGDVTYYAVFTPSAREYTVTWQADGVQVHSQNVAYGSPIPELPVPEKTGYTGAWAAVPVSMPASDYVIDAVYTPISYTITWNIDGVTSDTKWDYDTEPAYSGTPTKAADAEYTYTFSGWSPAITTVTGDATYTAVFDKTPNEYTVTWVAYLNDAEHGGSVNETFTTKARFGETITGIPSLPEATGYAAAWASIPATMPAQDITINAVYTYGARTVTWMINGDAFPTIFMDGDTPSYSGTATKPATAEYSYSFAGWSATDGGQILSALPTVDGANMTFYAIFTAIPNEYTVTWVADGTTVASEVIAYNEAVPTVEAPEKTGYYGDWDSAMDTMPAYNVTITAVYSPIPYEVTWSINGAANTTVWAYDSTPVYTGAAPEKAMSATTVYTFAGWATTEDGEALASIPTVTGDVTYYAVFTEAPREYIFTWYGEDGNELFSEKVPYGQPIPTKTVPQKTGYTGQWDLIPAAMPALDSAANAVYTPIKYTITWAMPSGNVTEQWDYDSLPEYTGETPVRPSTVSTVYTFIDWDRDITIVTGDATYVAVFAEAVREYEITWIVDGTSTTEKVAYGETPVFGGSTTKASTATTDYTFADWDKTVTPVRGDAAYTAVFTESVRKYTVTWLAEGKEILTEQVENGAAITAAAIPEKTGYTAAWDNIPETMPTENISINAIYTPIKYTVAWETPDGTVTEQWDYDSTPVYSGETPVRASTAEYEYTFSGWSPAIATVTGDMTYTAQFTQKNREYNITWVADGVIVATQSVAFGSAIPQVAIPEKPGYTGVWSNAYASMPARDISIDAVYIARLYTVYWKVDGITTYAESLAFGAAIPEKAVPDKIGHSGVWNNPYESMPAENITIDAVYTVNTYTLSWSINGNTGTAQVKYGENYETVFTYESLPEELRVTVGGSALDSSRFTYDRLTGQLTIPGVSIIGDISVFGRTDTGVYAVTTNLTNCTTSNSVISVPRKTIYHTDIIPTEGFLLPDSVEIYIDGVLITRGYVYYPADGRLTINAEAVLGDITIVADCPADPNYSPDAPEEPTEPTDPDEGGGVFASLMSFFERILQFFRRIFGIVN